MSVTAIDKIVEHAQRIAKGEHERVRPGLPMRFPEAAAVGDFGWQGDLKLTVIEQPLEGYVKVNNVSRNDLKLVPGETQGSRHCLDSAQGVTMYKPQNWPNSGLMGPAFVATEDRVVEHPTHGNVTIPAGMMIQCTYQREWDAEQRQERRNAD